MPTPMMESSASGESITRSGPYLSSSPTVARNTPPRAPTSSPTIKTWSSRPSSSSMAWRMPSIKVISATAHLLGINRVGAFFDGRVGGRFGVLDSLIDQDFGFGFHIFLILGRQQAGLLEGGASHNQWIVLFVLFDLLAGAVGAVIIVGGMGGDAVHAGF